jgi:hypothetical protein
MDTLQFEAVKMALKQNKDGYVLTMSIHPDEIPDDLMRDFVGSRYQVVMVRLGDDEMPLDRRDYDGDRAVKLAGVLCREKEFQEFLVQNNEIFDLNETEATEWLRGKVGIQSRSELKTNQDARAVLAQINKDYLSWKRN